MTQLLEKIIPFRPRRREPKAVKRWPEKYQLLIAHRHEMMGIKYRGR